MHVAQILKVKPETTVITVAPGTSVAEVAHALALEGRHERLAHALRAREPEAHRRPRVELQRIEVHAGGEQPGDKQAEMREPKPQGATR